MGRTVHLLGLAALAASFIFVASSTYAETVITTLAGTGAATSSSEKLSNNFPGDPKTTTTASANTTYLDIPKTSAVDSSGNVYISDTGSRRIRKVDATTGNITTVAGNGAIAFEGGAGDGFLAVNVPIVDVQGITVDSQGTIYFTETSSSRVRKVDGSTGIISTFAGRDRTIDEVASVSVGDGLPAEQSLLFRPEGLALDSTGNLYIADVGSNRIRIVSTFGVINTFAGTGDAGFSGDGGAATSAALRSPTGVTADSAGNVYIADSGNHRIRKVDTSGIISTIAGNGTADFAGDGGAATIAALNSPRRVAVDSSRNVYIADFLNFRVRKVDSATGLISTFAGGGTVFDDSATTAGDEELATSSVLIKPNDVGVFESGGSVILYVAEPAAHRVRKVFQGTRTTTLQDTDGDGFKDTLEEEMGSSSGDAASTPFEGVAPDFASTFTGPYKMTLSFTGRDSLSISGSFTFDGVGSLASKDIVFDIGGIIRKFTLDKATQNSVRVNSDRLKIVIPKPRVGAEALPGRFVASFKLRLNRGDIKPFLQDEGFVSGVQESINLPLRVLILFPASNAIYADNATLVYKGGKGNGAGTAFQD